MARAVSTVLEVEIKRSDLERGVREADTLLASFSGRAALFHPCFASGLANTGCGMASLRLGAAVALPGGSRVARVSRFVRQWKGSGQGQFYSLQKEKQVFGLLVKEFE